MGFEITVSVKVGEEIKIVLSFRKVDPVIFSRDLKDTRNHDFPLLKFIRHSHHQQGPFRVPIRDNSAPKEVAVIGLKIRQQSGAGLFMKRLYQVPLPLPETEESGEVAATRARREAGLPQS